MIRILPVFLSLVLPGCPSPKIGATPPGARVPSGRAASTRMGAAVEVVFMEPVGSHRVKRPTYRRITDPKKLSTLRRFMDNEAARLALALYRLAQDVDALETPGGAKRPRFHIALVRGGNHAALGFKLVDGSVTRDRSRVAYVKLGFRAKRFRTTLLHETGHVILGILSQGRGVPTQQVAALPHSTAALTDRGTAFNEGFAIHLETLFAHLTSDRRSQAYYQHRDTAGGRRFLFQSHYFFRLKDVMTYAQGFSRYVDVRDNAFSFQTALAQGDYYRVQLDRSRNQALLRSADQLLASEGFYATYFFRHATRRLSSLTRASVREAYRPIFSALARTLRGVKRSPVPAYLPAYLRRLTKMDPKHAKHAKHAYGLLYDLSHGVFFHGDAQALWSRLYRAALKIDIPVIKGLARQVARRKKAAVRECLVTPRCLAARIGPVLRVTVSGVQVKLPKLMGGKPIPLSFDLNTVQPAVLRLIPGVKTTQIGAFVKARGAAPFRSKADAVKRSGLSKPVLTRLALVVTK